MTQEDKMSDSLDKLDAILHRMETERIAAKEQLQMYRETIDKSMALYEKRMNENESRYTTLRGSLIAFVVLVVGLVVSGSRELSVKADLETVKQMDYATKTDAIRGDQAVVEGVMSFLEGETDIPAPLLREESKSIKVEAYREVTGEATRNIK